MSNSLMPVLFVPHGGGPMPLLGEPNHRELTAFMQSISAELPRPTAIVIVTAHWEESQVSISSSAAPGMLYDYYGFPPESYTFKYPVAGDPALAQQMADLLAANGIESRLDSRRDLDHGSFVPLMLMYPQANIPVVQLSLHKSLDPAVHIALGQALAPLRKQGVLILGSGMSFHNMNAFFSGNASTPSRSERFDGWLTETLTFTQLDKNERIERLVQWKQAPEALFCHPREEHLLPLHVCFGAASVESQASQKVFSGFLFNTKISAFLWG